MNVDHRLFHRASMDLRFAGRRDRPIFTCLAATALLAAFALTPGAAAAAPTSLLFEGFLRSAAGGPAPDGNYPISFALFEDDKAAVDFWQEGPVTIAVKGGQLSHVLGSTKALDSIMIAGKGQAWLQIKVGNDPALPRQKLHPVAYAVFSELAGGVACSNCIPTSALKFSDTFDIGGNSFKAGLVTAQKVQAGTVTAQSVEAGTISAQKYVGDGSGLTGVGIKAGACPAGKVVSGVDQSGNFICVSTAGSLPPDGLKFISNGVMTTNFTDIITSPKVPVGIPDNNPVGVADTIDVPDLGTAEQLSITIVITNSKLDTVEINIYDPANEKYVIWDKSKPGTKLEGTYPTVDAPVSGDLKKWWGKNPKGKWRIHVIDHAFKDNGIDGAIEKWTINLATNSNKKVMVNGDLVLTGKIVSAATTGSEVLLGSSNGDCTAEKKGLLRYHDDQVQVCNGVAWSGVGEHNALYRWAVWSTYGQAHGWFAGDNAAMFGGVKPSLWGDSNARAYQMSNDSEVLRTLFVRKGPRIGTVKNATVYAEAWRNYSSTNSRHVGALFRIRNATAGNVTWTPHWYRTAYATHGERASIALNGVEIWESGSADYGPAHASSHSIVLPPNRTSTVIFVASSSSPSGDLRACFMAFYNNSLALPAGLSYVDDLDTKPNGWDK